MINHSLISLLIKTKETSVSLQTLIFFLLLCFAPASTIYAENNNNASSAYVAIIIDDLGYKFKQDQRAINLPGQVTYAFLPHTPHLNKLTQSAHEKGRDIMLHLPMQAKLDTLYLGPGALLKNMPEAEFRQSVLKSIKSVPHIKGINNHMGSLITSQESSMNWLMDEISKTDLYFVDSRTTAKTLAEKKANQFHIKNTRRNIFLDHELNRPAIEFQFDRLIKLAKKKGSAVAIGHPFKETLDVLEEKIPQLKAEGIHLVPVSKLIYHQNLMRSIAKNKARIKYLENKLKQRELLSQDVNLNKEP
ncbi:MAG: divergent polysaccharide deacetylase family protein [Gammaproteobacteria bacterium]|nr:divergent polysaccharide deacetylase family protein [Gammaproteobacteria bacterium]